MAPVSSAHTALARDLLGRPDGAAHLSHLRLRVVDSITELSELEPHCIAVCGSHGGISSAQYALAARPLLSVFNDAGVGLEGAGIAALTFLQGHGLAACAVAHTSACIGQGRSTLERGTISHANALALGMGAKPGQACQTVVTCLLSAS